VTTETELKAVTIHTDGACESNPGPGGWAALLRYGQHARELTGGEPATTNNRMELQAAIAALADLKEPCEITLYTDSEYVRRGITEWLPLWKANRWRTTDRKPVKNDDLWRELDQQAARHCINWQWLKGHAGHPDNERCDQLAVAEIAKLRQRHTPEQLTAARETFLASRDPHRNQGKLL
jgi:ribonuclease HI